jgi:hypothetical protein
MASTNSKQIHPDREILAHFESAAEPVIMKNQADAKRRGWQVASGKWLEGERTFNIEPRLSN